MKVFVSFIFCFSTVFGAGKVYENRFAETLVVVDETLSNKLENTTDFAKEFFGFVNTVFGPVNIEITITDIIVGLLPFIYKCKNQETLGLTYDNAGVSLQLVARWEDRGISSSFDIFVALMVLLCVKTLKKTLNSNISQDLIVMLPSWTSISGNCL